jgi:hypothetical protein
MMDAEFMADLLGRVPTYTEATFTLANGQQVRGIARDMPRPGRRWTVNGWEWFIDAALLDRISVTRVDVDAFGVDVRLSA